MVNFAIWALESLRIHMHNLLQEAYARVVVFYALLLMCVFAAHRGVRG